MVVVEDAAAINWWFGLAGCVYVCVRVRSWSQVNGYTVCKLLIAVPNTYTRQCKFPGEGGLEDDAGVA